MPGWAPKPVSPGRGERSVHRVLRAEFDRAIHAGAQNRALRFDDDRLGGHVQPRPARAMTWPKASSWRGQSW